MPKHVQPKTVQLVIQDGDDGSHHTYRVKPQKTVEVAITDPKNPNTRDFISVDVGPHGTYVSTRSRRSPNGTYIGHFTTQQKLQKHLPDASDAAKVLLYRPDHMKRAQNQPSKKVRPVSARPSSNLQRMTKGGRAKSKAVPKPPHEATKRKGTRKRFVALG
jgi:hypothetical protein